jgi:ankyrin repeat protein
VVAQAGNTPLHNAAMCERGVDVIDKLLGAGARMDAVNKVSSPH